MCEKISSCFTIEQRQELFALLQQEHPNPKSELNYKNNFELLCAVMLSAQATDKSVNKATPDLFAKAPDAASMAALGEEGIAPYIKQIGLWRSKARNLAQTAYILQKDYQGQVPGEYKLLVKLPGVGSKTAKVVLNVGFNLPYIAVDTHIFRVCKRTGLCPYKTLKEVEKNLPDLVPQEFLQNAHHYLLLHGRYVCKARNPSCETCLINGLCKKLFD